ncbi:MAG: SLC13 family permease [Planctomycetota bacterium]|jgi:di/tricarboxylate transporter
MIEPFKGRMVLPGDSAMTPEIILVLGILFGAMVLLVTEIIPMEVTALLVLGTLALTELVNSVDALAGFSNPAVVTVWAVFILSAGLQRTGVANIIGQRVLRLAGRSETRIIMVIMLTAGVLSAAMNNVAVAALMLPVTMDIARQTRTSPSRLLMPLAFGSLLGGLTTMIGTPPNILASNALRDAGLPHFRLFDFTPAGVIIMLVGIVFMATLGRRFLPRRDPEKDLFSAGKSDLREQYALQDRMFRMRLHPRSSLVGKTIEQSRLGSVLGLQVLAITRNQHTYLSPAASETLRANDRLLVGGRLEHLENLSGWCELKVKSGSPAIEQIITDRIVVGEALLAPDGPLTGNTPGEINFRARFGLNILALRRGDAIRRTNLRDEPLAGGDVLLLQGTGERMEEFCSSTQCAHYSSVTAAHLKEVYRLDERLHFLEVPAGCVLAGRSLDESRLGRSLGLRVISVMRKDGVQVMPEPDERLNEGDRLLVEGQPAELEIALGLKGLEVASEVESGPPVELESDQIGLVEAVLSPRSSMAGKTLRQLRFREKHGLSVLAIWREGRAHRTGVRDMALRFGDALLLYGPREQLRALGRESDLVILTEIGQDAPPVKKAWVSTLVMTAVLVPVLIGVVPIYIAAVIGAALMVMFRCLTMEEAYSAIEWKAIFLIAGMLPLGIALDQTGAAKLIAEEVVGLASGFGPKGVMAGLVLVTFLATCIVPTAALVVLMAPIILNTSASMGISPHALMMAMALAASSSFTSPVSHPANLMVMGAGGYRFVDYIKSGVALTVVVFILILLVVPLFWPLLPP